MRKVLSVALVEDLVDKADPRRVYIETRRAFAGSNKHRLKYIPRIIVGSLLTTLANCIPFHASGQHETAKQSNPHRYLMIEAQDLGMATSVDRASIQTLSRNHVTSAEVLVPPSWFPEIVRYARNNEITDVGVELDLNAEWSSYRWGPLCRNPQESGLTDPAGYLPKDARYVISHGHPKEVKAEFYAQIEAALKAGLPVSHLDSHGDIALSTPWIFQEYWNASQHFGLPAVLSKEWVVNHGSQIANSNVYQVGSVSIDLSQVPFDRIIDMRPGFDSKHWLQHYENLLSALPSGIYLLQVHLGFDDEELSAMTADHPDWGAQWRQNDYDVMNSLAFRMFLKGNGFVLMNWKDISTILRGTKHATTLNQDGSLPQP